jgi:hypothetical protein
VRLERERERERERAIGALRSHELLLLSKSYSPNFLERVFSWPREGGRKHPYEE